MTCVAEQGIKWEHGTNDDLETYPEYAFRVCLMSVGPLFIEHKLVIRVETQSSGESPVAG